MSISSHERELVDKIAQLLDLMALAAEAEIDFPTRTNNRTGAECAVVYRDMADLLKSL